MSQKLKRLLKIQIITLGIVCILTSTIQAETITILAGSWPPHIDEFAPFQGTSSQIIINAFKAVGIEAKIRFVPWKRSFVDAQFGKFAGTILWLKTPEREKLFYISDPVKTFKWVFFKKKSFTFNWSTLEDLKLYSIGAVNGFVYSKEFDQAAHQILNVQYATTNEQNIQKLVLDRIQLLPMEIESGYHLIKELVPPAHMNEIDHHPTALTEKPLHLLMSRVLPENRERIEKFNRGLKLLNQTVHSQNP